MKDNFNLSIIGEKVTLVPYRPKHVKKYHAWMQDQTLLEQTASEPLTLQKEYEMQHQWENDANKCTFILIDNDFSVIDGKNTTNNDEINGMAGDINLFLNDHNDKKTAEIDVMVAEQKSRRKGIAKESVLLMMGYGFKNLGLIRFVAKIGFSNYASQQLFSCLGFKEIDRNQVFEEVVFEFNVNKNEQFQQGSVDLKFQQYD
eukprot:TRINITY_DN17262_c0_g1_i1.p3 TRINITY_DN17262_c0_g1~~TRINITY_DN17262_c0_g1_i1.p3  ORF type:complete len:202 (-),score=34.66 TRINITY_DN17262_c0_g1_i1:162-767(-)